MHPLEAQLRTWLQNWNNPDFTISGLESISAQAKTCGLDRVHLAAEEFLDAVSVEALEPVVKRCWAILDEVK